MAKLRGNRIESAIYLDPPAHHALKKLSEDTRVPVSVYQREAVSDLLAKYKVKLPKATKESK